MTTVAQLRTVYTPAQFAAEVLAGNRKERWVSNQCAAKRIRTVASRPYLIPQSEALRFISPK